jgi:DsbC/DsbD-like thiol-disulfide interchange protein
MSAMEESIMKRMLVGRTAAVLSLVMALAGWSLAGGEKEPVKIKVESGPVNGGTQVLKVHLDVAKPWHIYANPVENPDLEAAATVVKIDSKAVKAEVKYPKGRELKDNILGSYKVYEDKVTISVTLKRDAGSSGPLELTVRYQACDDKRCLPPKEIKQTVR